MPRNHRSPEQETQFVSTISSRPFTAHIVHNGETTEVPAQMTQDRRYSFSQEIPEDAVYVLRQEVRR